MSKTMPTVPSSVILPTLDKWRESIAKTAKGTTNLIFEGEGIQMVFAMKCENVKPDKNCHSTSKVTHAVLHRGLKLK